MNKSLLLIICDFLLISVLALVKFEPAPTENPEVTAEVNEGVSEDLMELLQSTLEIEANERAQLEKQRTELASNLDQTTAERDQLSEEKENLLAVKSSLEAERQQLTVANVQTAEILEKTSAQLEQTQQERERLAAERAALAAAKAALTENLQVRTVEAETLQANLQSREAALKAREAELEAARQAIAQAEAEAARLADERTRLADERAQLATSLEVARSERAQLDQSLENTREELDRTRAERLEAERRAGQLATDLTRIAQSSEALKAEIKASQPISSNEIFRRYEQNRISLSLTAEISGMFGTRSATTSLDAITVRTADRRLIIFEESRAPFRISNLDQVVGLSGSILQNGRRLPITRLGFLASDPRLIVVELLPTSDPALLDAAFTLTTDPFRFPEAVLISHTLGVYGLTDFRLLPGGEGYVGVNRNLINQLTGEFQPNRGDYIFAQSGELLGLMVEPERGILIDDLTIGNVLPIGDAFRASNARRIQPQLQSQLPR